MIHNVFPTNQRVTKFIDNFPDCTFCQKQQKIYNIYFWKDLVHFIERTSDTIILMYQGVIPYFDPNDKLKQQTLSCYWVSSTYCT